MWELIKNIALPLIFIYWVIIKLFKFDSLLKGIKDFINLIQLKLIKNFNLYLFYDLKKLQLTRMCFTRTQLEKLLNNYIFIARPAIRRCVVQIPPSPLYIVSQNSKLLVTIELFQLVQNALNFIILIFKFFQISSFINESRWVNVE
jgi:hypothetical protein